MSNRAIVVALAIGAIVISAVFAEMSGRQERPLGREQRYDG
jgi:hypothetical protein